MTEILYTMSQRHANETMAEMKKHGLRPYHAGTDGPWHLVAVDGRDYVKLSNKQEDRILEIANRRTK